MSMHHLVNMYLKDTLGINPESQSLAWFRVHEGATFLTQKMDLYLHPDKVSFENWLDSKNLSVSDQDLALMKNDLTRFYTTWRQVRKQYMDADVGYYQQACLV
jgi:hypothetical protein